MNTDKATEDLLLGCMHSVLEHFLNSASPFGSCVLFAILAIVSTVPDTETAAAPSGLEGMHVTLG